MVCSAPRSGKIDLDGVPRVSDLSQSVVEILKGVLGPGNHPLHSPHFAQMDERNLLETLRSGFVSSIGPKVEEFESSLAHFVGSRRAVACVNGTSALQLALVVAGVRPGDEVIVPAVSFVATANAVSHTGASPVFCDVESSSLGMDPEVLLNWFRSNLRKEDSSWINGRTRRRISAVVPVHVFGHPCQIERIKEVCEEFQVSLIEDAAEALGSRIGSQHVGLSGVASVLSFNGNKIITTGGGGAIITNDDKFADRAKHLSSTARITHAWEYDHDEVGYNFRMPNLNASLGLGQLSRVDEFVESKRRLFLEYGRAFESLEGVNLHSESGNVKSNYWLQAIVLDRKVSHERAAILAATNEAGIQTRPLWRCLHLLKPYKDHDATPTPVAEDYASRIINIPSSAGLV